MTDTRDTPEAALAAVLCSIHHHHAAGRAHPQGPCPDNIRQAAAILAALDGWTLVPSDAVIADAERLAVLNDTRALAAALADGNRWFTGARDFWLTLAAGLQDRLSALASAPSESLREADK